VKKLISVLTVLILALACCLPALAEEAPASFSFRGYRFDYPEGYQAFIADGVAYVQSLSGNMEFFSLTGIDVPYDGTVTDLEASADAIGEMITENMGGMLRLTYSGIEAEGEMQVLYYTGDFSGIPTFMYVFLMDGNPFILVSCGSGADAAARMAVASFKPDAE